jgi:hypothetical protein
MLLATFAFVYQNLRIKNLDVSFHPGMFEGTMEALRMGDSERDFTAFDLDSM